MKTLTKIVLVVSFLLFTAHCPLPTAYAEIPHLINYQGRLTDKEGKPVTDGTYQMTFRIFDAATAGNLLWEETHSSVLIQKGIFSILLGSVTNLNLAFDKPYYLEIKTGDEVMAPRQQITSAAYAISAENGIPRGGIIAWSGTISNIPEGWAICDGTNGTPDLRDRFIVGAKIDTGGIAMTNVSGSLTQTGGEATHTLTIAEMPAHAHTEQGVHQHGSGEGPAEPVWSEEYKQTGVTGNSMPHNNLPPYYSLSYIMKQ